MEGRISKAMNQKEKNVFEGPKKKPVNAAQKERKKGLQVRYTRLPELDRLSERFSLPQYPNSFQLPEESSIPFSSEPQICSFLPQPKFLPLHPQDIRAGRRPPRSERLLVGGWRPLARELLENPVSRHQLWEAKPLGIPCQVKPTQPCIRRAVMTLR